MSLSVSQIEPEDVDAVMDALAPMIERGLKRGQGDGETMESMRAAVKAGKMSLWAAHENGNVVAGMVFRLEQHAAKRKVFIEMLAGRDMRSWFDDKFHLLREFRDTNDADCIEASCRPGLARFLEQRGWTRKAVIMEMSQ